MSIRFWGSGDGQLVELQGRMPSGGVWALKMVCCCGCLGLVSVWGQAASLQAVPFVSLGACEDQGALL